MPTDRSPRKKAGGWKSSRANLKRSYQPRRAVVLERALGLKGMDRDGDGVVDAQEFLEGGGTTEMLELDEDGDGVLEKEEFVNAGGAVIDRLDKDGDGTITKQEFLEAGGTEMMFDQHDLDGDGILSGDTEYTDLQFGKCQRQKSKVQKPPLEPIIVRVHLEGHNGYTSLKMTPETPDRELIEAVLSRRAVPAPFLSLIHI
eukprot:TRINITY_DN18083_c0_g1_i2.p1 TRINITY_DN18083_c0_g1~~TRINITY_DN18083_c0_g1_i2.p1  ORF type:complete len:201 (-),score=37.40 TRINITY_DN18083_c0_g1_i2:125-727(-)